VFPNPANSCLLETDSCPLVGLAHVRIFCRCYSLVLNVVNLECTVMLAAMLAAMMLAAMILAAMILAAVIVFRVSHTGLSCYMFAQIVGFLNSRMDAAAATPNVMHCMYSLSHIITCAEKKMTRQTHPF